MNISYTTASAVPGIIADPATLDPQAVRCLWMRPVLDKDSQAAFLPSVVFQDGPDWPLACEIMIFTPTSSVSASLPSMTGR